MADPQAYVPRLKTHYSQVVRGELMEKFEFSNPMQVPRLDKVVLNIGVGEATQDTKKVNSALEAMQMISGQRPVITRARNSIATFKVREDMPLGVKVTLRRAQMYEFVDRLITVALPRVRDFRGLNPKSFDGNGNYALGLKEQFVFPEIEYDNVDSARGMDIIFVTSAKTDGEAKELLNGFDFPFNQQ
mgnify:CR=1 FL=1